MKSVKAELRNEGGTTGKTSLEIDAGIRRRAYDQQGCRTGHDMADCLMAEEEIKGCGKRAKAG